MSHFRLNAKKPKSNAGLATPKGEIYLLYREDIVSMPEKDPRGVLTTGDIKIKTGRRFHILYTTPSTQVHNRETEGDVDSRGWKKKITGNYPGDELEINEFVKNNVNQGFVALVKSCQSQYMKIYGSVNNPLYFTGSFTDDNEKKGYELTFEQTFADEDPVLFYQGKVLVDEDTLSDNEIEFQSIFVKLDGSNITDEDKEKLKEKLDIGTIPSNVATIDEGKTEGTVFTKTQTTEALLEKEDKPILAPAYDPLIMYPYAHKYLYVYAEDAIQAVGEPAVERKLKVPIKNITTSIYTSRDIADHKKTPNPKEGDLFIYTTTNGVVFQYQNGEWVWKGALIQNVAQNYLTTKTGAGLRLGANWEIDTAGFYMKFKGLMDKSADSTYGRALIMDSNGNVAMKYLFPKITDSPHGTTFYSSFNLFYVSEVTLSTNEYGGARIKFTVNITTLRMNQDTVDLFTKDNFKYYDAFFERGNQTILKVFKIPAYVDGGKFVMLDAFLMKNGQMRIFNSAYNYTTNRDVSAYATVIDSFVFV